MKKMRKGLLSLLLVFSMVFSMIPLTAAAAGSEDETVPDAAETGVIESLSVKPDTDDLPDNDELFDGWIQRQLYGGYDITPFADYGKNTLKGGTLAFYNELRTYIKQIAGGERASTVIEWADGFACTWTFAELGVGSIASEEEVGQIIYNELICNVFDCLLVDCPYELYWFDKTSGYSLGQISYKVENTSLTVWVGKAQLAVAEAYQNGDAYTVDTSKAKATTTAVNNAKAVVAANEGKSDYEKLVAYQQYICSMVEYNEDALDPSTPYGDPWQLIWVFDEDPDTKVVCEGYSKAFQYLCDLSTFQDDVVCYTVTGNMGVVNEQGQFLQTPGPHMWNIVTIGGKNYLVDVTNSDWGDTAIDILFLEGTQIRNEEGTQYIFAYIFGTDTEIGYYYEYDEETMGLYQGGELILAENHYHHTPSDVVIENNVPATCTETGSYDEVIYCVSCGEEISRETKTVPALGHQFGEWKIIKEATCTEAGSKERICDICGEKETEEIAALGHQFGEWTTVTEPTCTEDGSEKRVCSVCGETETREIAALGHKFGEWTTVTEPTCTEKGSEKRVCSVCGEIETREIAALGHKFGEWTTVTEPTCTENGSEKSVCDVCGEEVTREIEALGHNYQVTSEGKEATCTEDGITAVETCSRCGDVKGGEVIPALGHDYQVTKEAKEATCTEDGNTEEQTCSRCGEVKGGEVIPALGHDYQVTKEAKEATCTEDGNTEEQTCSRCGDAKGGEVIPAKGHQVDEWTTEKEPTCTEKGIEEGVCSVCGEKVTREIEALGHDYVVTKEGIEATCTEAGTTATEECSRCGDVRGGEEVPAKGHQWDEGKVTKEPTTTTEGEKVYTCEVCGETKTEMIPVIVETKPEQPTDTKQPTENKDNAQNGAPQTGDHSSVFMWMMLILASGVCIAGAAVVSQKKKRNR